MQDEHIGSNSVFAENANLFSLDARERQILEFYYIQNMTLEKCAGLFGVTRARAHQLKDKAVSKLVLQFYNVSFETGKLRESVDY